MSLKFFKKFYWKKQKTKILKISDEFLNGIPFRKADDWRIINFQIKPDFQNGKCATEM